MLLRLLAALGVVFALCCFASAEETAVVLDLTGAKPGSYLVTIDAQGGVTAVPLRIVKLGKPSVPPPPPVDPNQFEQGIQQLTQKALNDGGSKTTGAALSSVYSLVSSSVSDGSIAPDKAFAAVKKASDTVIAVQSDGAKWATFRKEVGDTLTGLVTAKKLDPTSKAGVADVLKQISNGMNKATGFDGSPAELASLDPAMAGILEGIDIAKLIELIKLIMELIKAFS